MSKKFEGSVAPRERINISYVPKTDGQTAEVELPLNMLVVGDTGNTQETSSLDERQAVSVNKHNFGAVMAEAAIGLNFTVPATLKGSTTDDELNVALNIIQIERLERLGLWSHKRNLSVHRFAHLTVDEIGRASCRERV